MPPSRAPSFGDEVKSFLEHLKHTILLPLSWWLTIAHFIVSLTWKLWTLPLRLSINFYEREVRSRFPWLPSILGTISALFPKGIKLPTVTSMTAGPYKGEGPTGADLPDLDNSALLDSIINGDAGGDTGAPQPNGDNRSKLDSSLRSLQAASPGDLDGALSNVKAAQVGAEKKLQSSAT